MAELRLEGLTKRFGTVTAVDGLDLVVADGELLVLLGASGAGKTTTLRLMAGLERPDAGRVLIGGRDLTAGGPAERDRAMQDVERRRRDAFEHLVEAHDLGPARLGIRRREAMLGRDARLHVPT